VRKSYEELSIASRPFGSLSEPDRDALRHWTEAARRAGIGSVEDLTARDWPAEFAGSVLGVFSPGDHYAAWLAVWQNGAWAVASCIDGSVSEPVESLADALAIVYRPGETPGCI